MSVEFKNLVDKVELINIYLVTSECSLDVHPNLVDPPQYTIHRQLGANWEIFNERFICSTIGAEFSGVHDDAPDEKAFAVKVAFRVLYEYPTPLTEFMDETIEQFAKANGTFNAYPYIREFVDQTFRRMGLPVFTVPLLKPRRPGDESNKEFEKPSDSKKRSSKSRNN